MSFKSLLFCPDEKTARAVTQVLSELDFTVESEAESFAAVKLLAEQHFDALVVDCQNEQDASLLFKAARNSTHNSSSLSVAVVEGQAGVARAFRIGANLVLTKPINVEQSKSTLRVARGLLKKAQPRPASPETIAASPAASIRERTEDFAAKPSISPAPSFAPSSSVSASAQATSFPPSSASGPVVPRPSKQASVPYSGLVLENEPEPVAQAEDLALLESLPAITGKRPTENSVPAQLGQAGPIAASTSGQAAATALAPETKVLEFRTAGAAPMVTNEAIVSGQFVETSEPEPFAAPTFSSLERTSRNSTGGRFLKIALLLAAVAGVGYFAWQQPQARSYVQKLLNRGNSAESAPAPAESADATPAEHVTFQPPAETPNSHDAQNMAGQPAPSPAAKDINSAQAESHVAVRKNGEEETIEVQELPVARDSGKISVAPKPQPIVVKNDTAADKSAQPVAPPLAVVSQADAPGLPSLAPANFELPKAAPGTVRISQGVSQGLLLKKVQPTYPSIARKLNKEGTVQLLATITKSGQVSKVQVLGGDPLLARSAVDAVKQWQYRPYLLNGLPVEIETQISIIFKN